MPNNQKKRQNMTHTVLNIQASARHDGSVTRQLSDKVLDATGANAMITRDLTDGLPLLDAAWLGANFTPVEERTDEDRKTLALSDSLIDEIKRADTLVIGTPIYNFSVPAVLKAWIDQVCRVGVTFKYTPNGPVGLLSGKRAIIVIASGGTSVGSDIDYASGYLKHIMGFIGINDVSIIAADALGKDSEAKIAAAQDDIENLNFKGADK
jgi:FMN-dependent NADH-azoreductase